MNELYIIQFYDDPYTAPYAKMIALSLEQAVNIIQSLSEDEKNDFCNIELFKLNNNVFTSAKKYWNENGVQINLRGEPINDEQQNIDYDNEINESLRIAGIQINEEYNEENIKINDIFIDSKGNEYKVTDIDDTYGEDKYGQPAVYVTFNNRMGMPSTSIKYILHKKQ